MVEAIPLVLISLFGTAVSATQAHSQSKEQRRAAERALAATKQSEADALEAEKKRRRAVQSGRATQIARRNTQGPVQLKAPTLKI